MAAMDVVGSLTKRAYRRDEADWWLILEGLARLYDLGARTAAVESGEGEAANTLYRACGFNEEYHAHVWRRLVTTQSD